MKNNPKKKILDIYPPHTFTKKEAEVNEPSKDNDVFHYREETENIIIRIEPQPIKKEEKKEEKEEEKASLQEKPTTIEEELRSIGIENEEPIIKPESYESSDFQTSRLQEPRKNRIPFVVLSLVFLGLVYYLGFFALAKAEVSITSKKLTLSLNNQAVLVDKNISASNLNQNTIPGNLFIFPENAERDFNSTGQGKDERKAKGTITIINNFSTLSQILVANTRFQTPDGKIFRLDSRIAIPGATTQDGKLIPSSIDASVTADQPGPNYNIPPCTDKCKFTIPGFQGTPKFEGFYGQSKSPMTGGSLGSTPMITNDDIKNAEDIILKTINDKIAEDLKNKIPNNLTILDGAKSSTNITNLSDGGVSAGDFRQTFTVQATGEVKVIAFREQDLIDLIRNQLNSQKPEQYDYCGNPTINYINIKPDFNAGTMKIILNATQTLCYHLDPQSIKKDIMGKNQKDLEMIFKSMDGVESSKIKFYPLWIKKVPNTLNKIKVSIDPTP
ncbi:MAG: hypothetical protein ACP5RX_00020 [Minisyncoccia bacterium]